MLLHTVLTVLTVHCSLFTVHSIAVHTLLHTVHSIAVQTAEHNCATLLLMYTLMYTELELNGAKSASYDDRVGGWSR